MKALPLIEEFFDVVDTSDKIVDRLARSEVHRQKLLHRAIHVFVFRSDGRLLIHKRSPQKEEFPSVWTSSCSGHVSSGETYDETAPRELLEELGIHASVKPLQKFAACAETSYEFTMLYFASSDEVIHPDPDEMTEVRWMNISEILTWLNDRPADFSTAFEILFRWYVSQSACN
jgi:isopentenyl-diphosphate delta-isomerase type 1